MRTRALAACVTAALTALTMAGCGGHTPRSDAKAAQALTAGATGAALPGGGQRSATPSPGGGPFGATLRRMATKAQGARSARITEVLTFGGRKVRLDGLYVGGARPAMDVRVPTAELGFPERVSSSTTELRVVAGIWYVQIAPQARGPLHGKHWMRVAPADLFGTGPAPDPGLIQAVQQDPVASLRMLADTQNAVNLGTENVNGTTAPHYAGTLPGDRLGADTRLLSGAGASSSALRGGTDSIGVSAWPGSDGMPVYFVETFGDPGLRSIAVDFGSFGGPRTVSAPPAADTGRRSASA